ncbi:hypothetical protein CYY_006197 [Polysphondylium violaceum]|uniref:Telomere length regulation protein conserved domain-containing protein n=1 Tax=Polysphondylium violaceum TaxID=133409 RepID=A0A8J4PRQ9_9MYCE|nr:hypothetical protein CYY_006197 [Polysphondylium violaceum]
MTSEVSINERDIIQSLCQSKNVKDIIEHLRELKSILTEIAVSKTTTSAVASYQSHGKVVSEFLKILLENVLDNWYFAFNEPDKQLFESFFFINGILVDSYIVLSTFLLENYNSNNSDNSSDNSFKLNFVINILYKFYQQNYISKLFKEFQNNEFIKIQQQQSNSGNNSNQQQQQQHQQQYNTSILISSSTWDMIIHAICTIPDLISTVRYQSNNNYSSKQSNKQQQHRSIRNEIFEYFLDNKSYFNSVVQQCIDFVNYNVSIKWNNEKTKNLSILSNQISLLFSKMIKLSYKDPIIQVFIKHFNNKYSQDKDKDNLSIDLCAKIIISLQGSSLDSFIESLIRYLPNYKQKNQFIKILFGKIYSNRVESRVIVYVMTNKMVLNKVFDNGTQNVYMDLLAYLFEENGTDGDNELLFNTLQKLLISWSDLYYIRHCTNEQHSSICRYIIYFMKRFLVQINTRQELKNLVLKGVDLHLKSTLGYINVRGMVIAELFSKCFVINDGGEDGSGQLSFTYDLNTPDQQCFSLVFDLPNPINDDGQDDYDNVNNSNNSNSNSNNNNSKKNTKEKDNYIKQMEREFSKYEDPDKPINFDDDDQDDGFQKARIEEIDDDDQNPDDDDDDLVPYNLDDDESDLNPIKKKIYLRDCLLELQSQKHTADSWEVALESISSIVWKNPDDLDDLSETLATSLLHLTNEYEVDNFVSIRHEALVALACQSTQYVVPYLTKAFSMPNFSLAQRVEILDVLADSSKHLSGKDDQSKSVDGNQLQQQQQQDEKHKMFIINKESEKTTATTGTVLRRWGVAKHTRPQPKTNEFHLYAKMFFYPLLQKYDRVTQCYSMDLIGYDSFVLAKLVHTLGVIIECAENSADIRSMSKEFVRFLWSLRSHQDANVRRSLLFAFSRVFFPMSLAAINQDYSAELEEILSWLYNISQNDPDKDTRVMSLAIMSNIVNQKQ